MFTGRLRRFVRDVAVFAFCGLVGFLVVAVPRFVDTDDGRSSDRANPRIGLSELADGRDPATPVHRGPSDVEPPGPPAATPVEVVERFLSAEVRADYATSYGFLSAADRAELGSRSEWETAHGQFPTPTGVKVGAARNDGTRAEVDAELTFEPALDETRGLVPARADSVWIAVSEDGGWRVARSESRLSPQYPDPTDAVNSAQAWAQARIACRTEGQYEGGLVGSTTRASELCNATGPVTTGAAMSLEPGVGVEPFLAAFGPDVLSWARVVPVTSPVPVSVVLAPIGDRWVVVGALDSLPEGSP